jgi:hypothetical protein
MAEVAATAAFEALELDESSETLRGGVGDWQQMRNRIEIKKY